MSIRRISAISTASVSSEIESSKLESNEVTENSETINFSRRTILAFGLTTVAIWLR
jgi:hypothetical protein